MGDDVPEQLATIKQFLDSYRDAAPADDPAPEELLLPEEPQPLTPHEYWARRMVGPHGTAS